jgi:hypothetical protein
VNVDLEDLLRAGQLEKVEVGLIEAELDLRAATQHLASARQIYLTDPLGSFQFAYDSARKCLQGFWRWKASGLENPQGAAITSSCWSVVQRLSTKRLGDR